VTSPRRRYPTDLTDAEWQLLAPLIPAAKPGGRPAIHDRRKLVNAMAYWLRAGVPGGCCPMICRPGRPSTTTSAPGSQQGLWKQVHATLRTQERLRQGRRPTPSAAILDSQSVKTTERGAPWHDGAKKLNGPQAPPAGRHPRAGLQGPGDAGRCG